MQKVFGAVALAVVLSVAASAGADEDGGAPRPTEAGVCQRTRTVRVEAVQIRTRQWMNRLASIRGACTATWVKTGAVKIDRDRVGAELRGDVQCPKGPPAGETKESVWSVLSLFLDPPVITDEQMVVGEETLDTANVKCTEHDAAVGLKLRPLVNDLTALRGILAWKPAKTT